MNTRVPFITNLLQALPGIVLLALLTLSFSSARAQDNYEIQVYGSETVAPRTTMVELHSNFTIKGTQSLPGLPYTADGTYPTHHMEHETVEITQGINNWAEVGFYLFTAVSQDHGWEWVGDHIRPRVRAPDSWHLPVGLSISNEFGYQRARYSPDTWTWEMRPIIDKSLGRWYFAFNPTFDKSFHGPAQNDGFGFSPNVKVGYDFTRKINAGLEYYGAYGNPATPDALHDQQQQLFVVTDLNVSPKWELNFGIGVGATASTDHLIMKTIVGRRFNWPTKRSKQRM